MLKLRHFTLVLIMLPFCTGLKAQYIWARPAVVNIDLLTDTFPYPVFLIQASNFFEFASRHEIIACTISTSENWSVADSSFAVKKLEGQYEIGTSRDGYERYKAAAEAPAARINFVFKDGTVKWFVLKLNVYPPVKVEFFDSLRHVIDISGGVIKYSRGMTAHSKVDPAFYVSCNGLREDFTLNLTTESGLNLGHLEGWHDAGHMIRWFDLSAYKEYKVLYGTLRAFGDGNINFQISKYDPPVLKIVLDE